MEVNNSGDNLGWSDEDTALGIIDEHPAAKDQNPIKRLTENSSETEENEVEDFISEELYNPAEFANLPVGPEIKEIFQLITSFNPQVMEIEPKLKPFIPDLIPAVGDIDPFVKVDRPDGQRELLGLNVLDEPSLHQSDPSILDLKLRSLYKQTSAKTTVTKKIDDFIKNPKLIDKWITDISQLHHEKPSSSFNYTSQMPDMDALLQEWPAEVEEMLKESAGIPPADLDCSLTDYIDILCGLLDIPTGGSRIEALHLLFTVYSEVCSAEQV